MVAEQLVQTAVSALNTFLIRLKSSPDVIALEKWFVNSEHEQQEATEPSVVQSPVSYPSRLCLNGLKFDRYFFNPGKVTFFASFWTVPTLDRRFPNSTLENPGRSASCPVLKCFWTVFFK